MSGGSVYPQVASHIQEKNFDLNDDPSKQKSYQFDKGASTYGSFMLGYKRDRKQRIPQTISSKWFPLVIKANPL